MENNFFGDLQPLRSSKTSLAKITENFEDEDIQED
jgi:hypothetical protein